MKKQLLTTSAIAAILVSSPAQAGGVDIEALQSQINELQRQMQVLQAQLEKKGSGTGAVVGDVKIEMKPSPKISSTDGKYEFQPFGRVHLDTAFFGDDKKDHGDNANFRRARLGFKGKVDEDWKYKFEMDFAKEDVAFKDVSLTYTGFDVADIQAGHFKPFFGLEENTSSNYIQFMERSSAGAAFTRDEELGIGVKSGGDNWSASIGVWNEDGGTDTASTDDEAYTVDGRVSFAPVNEKGRVVHLGAGGSYRVPNAGSDSVALSSKVTGAGANLVTTGAIANTDSTTLYNLEAAGVYEGLALQGEYFMADVSRESGTDPSFSGWYAQASYLLTGETRPYAGKIGNFSRVKPKDPFSLKKGGTGAWEVLTRLSNVDLNDQGAGITGGELDDWTVGVNWYLNNNFRMMANYVSADTDENAAVANDDPDVYMLRASWDF